VSVAGKGGRLRSVAIQHDGSSRRGNADGMSPVRSVARRLLGGVIVRDAVRPRVMRTAR
jgi:hypothetical protein